MLDAGVLIDDEDDALHTSEEFSIINIYLIGRFFVRISEVEKPKVLLLLPNSYKELSSRKILYVPYR